MIMKLAAIVAALILTVIATSAEARTRHQYEAPSFDRHDYRGFGSAPIRATAQKHVGLKQIRRKYQKRAKPHRTARVHIARHHRTRHVERQSSSREAQIVAHPAGCPRTLFCGCGSSIEVFGRSIRELWLARNWFRFPQASPAPGMVAVRRHHVFVIRKVIAPGRVLAYDPNSGGHKTRIHVRSLRGYSVRNPHGSRYASAG